MELATISFQPEAHQTAERLFNELCARGRNGGFIVTVVPVEGEPFDAEMVSVDTNEEGFLCIVVAPWIESEGRGDRDNPQSFDIYTELQRIEVL